MALPPQFMKKGASGAKAPPFGKKPAAKLCPGCKNPACKKAGKCAKKK